MEVLQNHALDVYYTPIFMKKNRPAYMLSVLAPIENEKEIEKIIFQNTTAIGLRKTLVDRTTLERKIEKFIYLGQDYSVKLAYFEGETFIYPEYESAKKLAEREHLPIKKALERLVDLYINKK